MTITIDYGFDVPMEKLENVYCIAPHLLKESGADAIIILSMKDGRSIRRVIRYNEYVKIVIH